MVTLNYSQETKVVPECRSLKAERGADTSIPRLLYWEERKTVASTNNTSRTSGNSLGMLRKMVVSRFAQLASL